MTLKEARRAAGLTQAALASAAGVNIRQIQKLESGELAVRNMTLKNSVAIAKALGITAEQLLKTEEGA